MMVVVDSAHTVEGEVLALGTLLLEICLYKSYRHISRVFFHPRNNLTMLNNGFCAKFRSVSRLQWNPKNVT